MTPETRRELQELVSLLCEGELAQAQHQRLEALLAADAECRRFYLEYLDLHAQLLVHPLPSEAEAPVTIPASAPRSPLKKYAAVVAATLAASLLLQVFLHTPPPPAEDSGKKPAVVASELPKYLATLTQSADCLWDGPAESLRVGSRLLPGELVLRQGVARIDFESGPSLVVEAPARLRLQSSRSATVVYGKVFFKADETAPPFDLHTPTSTLVDLGTEYAVSVNPQGEEVYVFKGEVQRRPKTAGGVQLENLKEGQARRYVTASNTAAEPIPLESGRFARQVADVGQAPVDADLLAYEGFDYQTEGEFKSGQAAGGRGWAGPWDAFLIRPLRPQDQDRPALSSNSLRRPETPTRSIGGAFDYTGFSKFYRRLATPVRLDTDGVYYLSFLFRREGPPDDDVNAVAVLFWTDEDYRLKPDGGARQRLNIGVRGVNELFTSLQDVGVRTPLPLTHGETYLMVAKIVAGAANPDQILMRVYGPGQAVENAEPASWSVVSPSFESDSVFDWLQLHINSKTRQTIDEVRLGTTWRSVAAAWISPK